MDTLCAKAEYIVVGRLRVYSPPFPRDGVSFVGRARMRVFHGRGNVGMTHEFLDGDEIDPQANKASGESMAKIVEAAASNPGSPQRAS